MTWFITGYAVVFLIAWVVCTAEFMNGSTGSDPVLSIVAGGILAAIWPLTLLGYIVFMVVEGLIR